ncbi:hypothetical protein SAMN04488057_110153 [Cyclobacterium lianum]|uniref:MerC mercury resistance protein n=1 Tax=Cyclobacterium lianum TaxID=388280 RepID=A0A1M7PU01_9BACT|nr:hypothetical protein [Cyclobacterium lianum]SHN20912.1 hypothetical protein SAMN04488057_110153 [Cyclobacterium lianum]
MKENINTTLHSLSLASVLALLAWYYIGSGNTAATVFTWMIIVLIAVEIISLILVSGIYPESHTSFKIGIIAMLFILLGIKAMLPSFFVPLTVTLIAVNFLYNFYTNNKRKKGAFKRKKKGLKY